MSHFREQLVCALVMSNKTDRTLPLEDLIKDATLIAVLCCASWGHPWNDREPNGKPAKGAVCSRCGARS